MNSFHLLQTLKLFTALHGNLIIIAGPVISPLMLLAISLVLKPSHFAGKKVNLCKVVNLLCVIITGECFSSTLLLH